MALVWKVLLKIANVLILINIEVDQSKLFRIFPAIRECFETYERQVKSAR